MWICFLEKVLRSKTRSPAENTKAMAGAQRYDIMKVLSILWPAIKSQAASAPIKA